MELTEKQAEALGAMLGGESVLISGEAGTGKSAILREFLARGPEQVAVTSTTGVSAIDIGGRTLHSWAGIGLGQGSTKSLARKIIKNKEALARWHWVRTLVIDEISMLSGELFDKLEELARVIRKSRRPFGGIQVIAIGDFCQLPVIGEGGFCFQASSWFIERSIILDQVIRQADPVFRAALSKLRFGECDEETEALFRNRVMECPKGDLEPTRLFSRNAVVDHLNDQKLEELCQEITIYRTKMAVVRSHRMKGEAVLKIKQGLRDKYPDAKYAPGAQVILRWNVCVEGGLANGSRGVVEEVRQGRPLVRFKGGRTVLISPVRPTYETEQIKVEIEWMPISLGWACSIHKSQGATLDLVVTSLGRDEIWEYGQGYVALSRVRTLEGLYLEEFDPNVFKCHPAVREFYLGDASPS